MPSNRDVDFVKHVLNRVAGIAIYQKSVQYMEDKFVVFLRRGVATNKATRIEFRPDRLGAVNVTFLKGREGEEKEVSSHPGVPFDGLASLLIAEAGLLTGERQKEEGVGLYKTSKW